MEKKRDTADPNRVGIFRPGHDHEIEINETTVTCIKHQQCTSSIFTTYPGDKRAVQDAELKMEIPDCSEVDGIFQELSATYLKLA